MTDIKRHAERTGETTILFVRHTEVHNPDQVLYGRLPRFDLSPAGHAHADRVARRLAGCPVSLIVSSPLLRARRVAQVIARCHPSAPVRQSRLLIEVGSSWHGTPFGDFPAGFSTFHNRRADTDESMEQIRDRMLRFVGRTARRHPGETVVAVSHGDPITILRVVLLGLPLALDAIRGEHYAALGSITRVVVRPGGDVVSVDVLDQTP